MVDQFVVSANIVTFVDRALRMRNGKRRRIIRTGRDVRSQRRKSHVCIGPKPNANATAGCRPFDRSKRSAATSPPRTANRPRFPKCYFVPVSNRDSGRRVFSLGKKLEPFDIVTVNSDFRVATNVKAHEEKGRRGAGDWGLRNVQRGISKKKEKGRERERERK